MALQTSIRLAAVTGLLAAASLHTAWAAGEPAPGLPDFEARPDAAGKLTSMGDSAMAPLMDAWLTDYLPRQPGAAKGAWVHFGATGAPYGLANRVADIAPLAGPLETLTYRIRFQHDGVQSPVAVQVGTRYLHGKAIPLYLVVHGDAKAQRPLEPRAMAFLAYALSRQGQQVLATHTAFVPLDASQATRERARLAALAPARVPAGIPGYVPGAPVAGSLRSVGSALPGEWMDRALAAFQRHHPQVVKGGEWRYLGGTSAMSGLLAGVSDIAPLGRDLSALESAQFRDRFGQPGPRTLRIAQSRPKEIRSRALGVFVPSGSPLKSISIDALDQLFAHPSGAAPVHALRPIAVAGDEGLTHFMTEHWHADAAAGAVTRLTRDDALKAISTNDSAVVLASLELFEKLPPGVRQLPVSAQEGMPATLGSLADIAAGRYPLVRPSFVHMLLPGGTSDPIEPAAAEFIRFLLSREGQELAVLEGFGALMEPESESQVQALGKLPLRSAIARTAAPAVGSAPVVSSMGDAAAAPLMQAWLDTLRQHHPGIQAGTWVHAGSTATPHGLTNHAAELAPLVGKPDQMTYRVRFRRGGIDAPLLIPVALQRTGTEAAQPVTIAVHGGANRPVSKVAEMFLRHALSPAGQALAAATPGFEALPKTEVEDALRTLDALYRAPVSAPHYQPRHRVSGPIDSVGAAQQGEWMERAFAQFQQWHPGVHKGEHWRHPGSSAAISAVLADVGGLSPLGRELLPRERQAYRDRYGIEGPLTLKLAHGPRVAPSRSSAMAIYVHPSNPVTQLTVDQLDAIFSAKPRGKGNSLRHWKQAGIEGAAGEMAVRPYLFADSNAPASIQHAALKNEGWSSQVQTLPLDQSMQRVASEPGAIAMGYFDDPTPGIRLVPITAGAGKPASSGSPQDIASGRYPLIRDVYLLLNRRADRPMAPQTAEFIRFLLSREGQEIGVSEGYFPLSDAELRVSLRAVGPRPMTMVSK